MPCRLELGIPREAVGASGHRGHYLVPTSLERPVEIDKVRARTGYGTSRGRLFYMVSVLPKVRLIVLIFSPSPGAPAASKSSHNLGDKGEETGWEGQM